jgi:hypothetical protein
MQHFLCRTVKKQWQGFKACRVADELQPSMQEHAGAFVFIKDSYIHLQFGWFQIF